MFRFRHAIVIALVMLQAVAGRAQTPAEIHGTWTAELRNGEAFLQVRTTPPPDWDRSNGDRDGGWNMGQSFPIDQMSFSSVTGRSRMRFPVAWKTALAIAGATPTMPTSRG